MAEEFVKVVVEGENNQEGIICSAEVVPDVVACPSDPVVDIVVFTTVVVEMRVSLHDANETPSIPRKCRSKICSFRPSSALYSFITTERGKLFGLIMNDEEPVSTCGNTFGVCIVNTIVKREK